MGAHQDGPGPESAEALHTTTISTVTDLLSETSIEDTNTSSEMLTTFTCFPNLPTELRLKIWHLSFVPRVIEVHRRKSHYADSASSVGQASLAKWQSWSANPAALAVSFEARSCALEHYSATIRLAVNTPCERAGEARLDLHRRLYIAPHADTLAMLGEFNVAQTVELMRHINNQTRGQTSDDVGRGLQRLALCASSIGHPGSGILLTIYGRNIFRDLDRLVLFLYDERVPPTAWTDGHCALVDCRDTYTFRRFQVGQGAELKSQGGKPGWMTVGHNPLEVLDLAFGREAEAASKLAAPVTKTTITHKSGARSIDDNALDKQLPQVTTIPLQPDRLDDNDRLIAAVQ
ncbi:hypothetical protein Sste5346_001419 [Sporothrix stenoceras]|uniref:2EXR domain-containing protein n=1 Tax=Sporothrix stenoceras TaxID=5173 RepID=A0ABR3ZP03_9PEZI